MKNTSDIHSIIDGKTGLAVGDVNLLDLPVDGENLPATAPTQTLPRMRGREIALYSERDMGNIEAMAFDAAQALREWARHCEETRKHGETQDMGLVHSLMARVVDETKALDGIAAWTIQDLDDRRASPRTIAAYRKDIRDFLIYCALRGLSPAHVGQPDVKNYLALLKAMGAPQRMEQARAEWYGHRPRVQIAPDERWLLWGALEGWHKARLKIDRMHWALSLLAIVYGRRCMPMAETIRETLYSPGTIGLKLTVVRVFFKMAIARQAAFENPALGLKGPHDNMSRVARVLSRYFSDEEFTALMKACPTTGKKAPIGIRNRCLLALARVQGLRISEVCHLDLDDYNPSAGEAGTLMLRGAKGNKSRVVNLAAEMKELLEEWLTVRNLMKLSTPALFVSMSRGYREDTSAPGERITDRGIRAMFDGLQQQLGIKREGRSFHGLRHSFATRALGEGADLGHVSEQMGHASRMTTETYVHLVEILRDNPAKFAAKVLHQC